MKEAQQALLRKIHAENAAIFCFIQGLITSSESPRLILMRMQQAHDLLMAGLLNDPGADQRQIDLIAEEHAGLVKRIEHFMSALQSGQIAR